MPIFHGKTSRNPISREFSPKIMFATSSANGGLNSVYSFLPEELWTHGSLPPIADSLVLDSCDYPPITPPIQTAFVQLIISIFLPWPLIKWRQPPSLPNWVRATVKKYWGWEGGGGGWGREDVMMRKRSEGRWVGGEMECEVSREEFSRCAN